MVVERIGDGAIESQLTVKTTKPTTASVPEQFEAVFLKSMCKNSCIDQHFAHESTASISVPAHRLPVTFNLDAVSTQPVPVATLPEMKSLQSNLSIVDFVSAISPFATAASHVLGLDPNVLIAQAALETGWGQFIAKDMDGNNSNNLFNIKSVNSEPSVKIKTTEYINNTPVKMKAYFKKYASVEDCFKDYISLIQGQRYQAALASTHDPVLYVKALHQAGYATDPDYASKVLSIYHGDELQRALEQSRSSIV